MQDSDWDVYKQISRDPEESDSDEDNLKAQVSSGCSRKENSSVDKIVQFAKSE